MRLQDPSLLSTLLVLMLGLATARFMEGRLSRWAMPAIVIELGVGFLLGNTVLPYKAVAPLSGLTELGVLSLFFQVGLEVRGDLLVSRRGTILRLVALSFLTPLLAYGPLVSWFAMKPATALLCLACLSATGTGVTLRLLAQRQALQSPTGRLLVGVSVLDDLPAIALLSLAVATGAQSLSRGGTGWLSLMSGVAAAALSYGLTSWWIRHRPERPTSNMAVLMMLIGSAWVGEVSGLTSLLGALWGGVLVSRLCPRESQDARLLGMVSDVFLPLYFISVGMRVSAGSLLNGAAWLLAGVLLVAALLSKLACGFGVTASDSNSGIDRWTVVYGLIPRGLPGLVFASTALNAGVINDQQFSALVIMVTVTTVLGLMLLEARLLQSRDRAATAKPPEALA
jgi:Kef-type K+ transport system membrane component KefB